MPSKCKHCWGVRDTSNTLCSKCILYPRCKLCTVIIGEKRAKFSKSSFGVCYSCDNEKYR